MFKARIGFNDSSRYTNNINKLKLMIDSDEPCFKKVY